MSVVKSSVMKGLKSVGRKITFSRWLDVRIKCNT